jgi:RND family efflux transporter MFP subunit
MSNWMKASRMAAVVTLSGLAVAPWGVALSQPAATEAARVDVRVYSEFGEKAVTRPSRDATMGFSMPTQVREVMVKGGDKVKKGQLLARGDDEEDVAFLKLNKLQSDTDLPVQKARAALELSKLEFERIEEAFKGGAAAQQDLDRARLNSDGARIDWETAKVQQEQAAAQVQRAEARVSRLNIRAPFDGQIDSVQVDAGQALSESDKVLRIVNVDLIWIDVPTRLDRAGAIGIKQDDPAWVLMEVDGAPSIREGRVIEVSPVADPASRTRRVRVEIKNPEGPAPRLVPGEPAWVRFEKPGDELLARLNPGARAMSAGETSR